MISMGRVLTAAALGLVVSSAAQAATTVVLPGDVGPGPNPAAASWHYSVANPTAGSSGAIVNGIGTPPLNSGSYHSIMSGGGNYVSLDSGNRYEGLRLSDLENVTFSFYNDDPGSIYVEEMVVILRYDQDGDLNTVNDQTTDNGRIWLQPVLNGGSRPDNQWHTVSFDRDDAVWEIGAGTSSGFGLQTLDFIYSLYPNAVLVGNTGAAGVQNSYKSTFRIANGSGGTANDGYFDALNFTWDNDQDPTLDTNLVTDTFDFEAQPVPEPASMMLLAAGAGLVLRRRKA